MQEVKCTAKKTIANGLVGNAILLYNNCIR